MKNMFKLLGIILVTMIAFSTTNCKNNSGIGPEEPEGITVEARIDASIPSVLRGERAPFSAAVKGTSDKTVTWSIGEEDRHPETDIATDPATGQTWLKVSEDEQRETLTIRAVSNADPSRSGEIIVTIPIPQIDAIEISLPTPWVVPWLKKVDVGQGGEIEFVAKVIGKNFIREAITWAIDNESKHNGTTIIPDANGVAQLHVAQAEGLTFFKVQAVSKWDDSIIGEVTVTVQEPTATGVFIYDDKGKEITNNLDTAKKIKQATSETFYAVVTGTGKVNQNVIWEMERLSYKVFQPGFVNGEFTFGKGWLFQDDGTEEMMIYLDDNNGLSLYIVD
jgi:hypothetical protein